jgi:hypothetical protein
MTESDPKATSLNAFIKRVPPAYDGKQQHAIRSTLEQHDRVGKESELMRGLKAQLPDLRCVHFPQARQGDR